MFFPVESCSWILPLKPMLVETLEASMLAVVATANRAQINSHGSRCGAGTSMAAADNGVARAGVRRRVDGLIGGRSHAPWDGSTCFAARVLARATTVQRVPDSPQLSHRHSGAVVDKRRDGTEAVEEAGVSAGWRAGRHDDRRLGGATNGPRPGMMGTRALDLGQQ